MRLHSRDFPTPVSLKKWLDQGSRATYLCNIQRQWREIWSNTETQTKQQSVFLFFAHQWRIGEIGIRVSDRKARWMWRGLRCAIAWWIFYWRRITCWRHSSSSMNSLMMAETIKPFVSRSSSLIPLSFLPIRSRDSTLSEVKLPSFTSQIYIIYIYIVLYV